MQVNDGGTATYLPCCRSLPTRRRSGLRKNARRRRKRKAEARRAQKRRAGEADQGRKNQRDEHAAERVNKTDEASEADWENTVTITASSIEAVKRSAITSRMSG